MYAMTASLSWVRLGIDRPSVAMFEPSTTTCCGVCSLASSFDAVIVESSTVIRAVLWDFGGVILSSPFEAFNRYEATNGLPADFIRRVNAAEPDTRTRGPGSSAARSTPRFDAAFADESERSATGARQRRARPARRRGAPGDGRRARPRDRGRLHDGVPDEQRRRWRAPAPTSPRSWPLRPRRRVEQGRRAQAGAGVLRAGLPARRGRPRRSACSSTTSASTSSRPRRWA